MNPEKVLPPGVNGNVTGYLTVKVDEVFWGRNSPGEVCVQLLWWGEKNASVFSPKDITHSENHQETECYVTYTIKTSSGLFQAYLKNCGKIKFTILRGQNKNVVIGSTVIYEIDQVLMTERNFSSYYPVFSPKGKRLGDIHIGFDLKFVHKPLQVRNKQSEKNDIVQPKDFRRKHFLHSKPSSAASNKDQVLSNLMEKGSGLRNAMIMSVLADCPTDEIDTVLNDEAKTCSAKKEAKLVDLLLGKELSVSEEMKAIDILRCISPEKKIEPTEQNLKCSKVSCCLHGEKCDKVEKVVSKSVAVTSDHVQIESVTSPFSIDQTNQDKLENQEAEEPPKVFNCYRLIVKSLILNPDGTRKIYYAPGLSEINRPNPPGTAFTLEISFPNKHPSAKPLKFTTKKYKGKSVTFEQGTTHKLCGTATWARVKNNVLGSVFTIYWRHLNQRVPCPLGSARIDSLSPSPEEDCVSLTLPVYSNNRLLTGHLQVSIGLGISSKNGGEILYRHLDTQPDPIPDDALVTSDSPEPCTFSSVQSVKPENVITSNEPSVPVSSSSSDYGDGQAEACPSALDDELLRTINLLNSKTDNVNSNPLFIQEPVVEKKEVSIQTSLVAADCLCCGHTQDKYGLTRREKINRKYSEDKDVRNVYEPLITNPSRNERCNDFKDGLRDDFRAYMLSKENSKELHKRCDTNEKHSYIVDNDKNIGTVKIHEYNIKIEKVAGVPLFNGDKDLDCYVDYSFPIVDANNQIKFGEFKQTEVQMALRETGFKTVFRHRLELKCKLNQALLALPTHDIIFRLWGRSHPGSSQDCRLGKGTLPLRTLTALELKYEQQMERRPIIEKFVLPINVLESRALSGFKGSFGDMYINIMYSNISSLSYREWLCKIKDGHLCCRPQVHQNSVASNWVCQDYVCPKSSPLNYEFNTPDMNRYESHWASNRNAFKRQSFTETINDIRDQIYSRKLEYLKKDDDFLAWKTGDSSFSKSKHTPLQFSNRNDSDKKDDDFLVWKTGDSFSKSKHTPLQFSNRNDCDNFRENVAFGRVENIVKKTLMELKERRVVEKTINKPEKSLGDIKEGRLMEPNDPFESFDMRADFSSGDSLDFEAQSQYSFLKTPPPIESTLAKNDISDSESVLSARNQNVKHGIISNPFTTHSSRPLSLDSLSSLFIKPDASKHNSELNEQNLKSNSHKGNDYDHQNIPQKSITNNQMKRTKEVIKNEKTTKPPHVNECILSSSETLESVVSIKSSCEAFQPLESNEVAFDYNNFNNNEMKDSVITPSKDEYFKARVEICRASGLPPLKVKYPDGNIALVKPSSRAYFTALLNNKETGFSTRFIENKSAPIWNCSWDVFLPIELLIKCDREFEIFVDLKGTKDESPARASDSSMHWPVVLRTGVDLTPLTAGLEMASGWFTLTHRALASHAQIMVIVTPLEDISRYRKDWLKEYTKSKGEKTDTLFISERDSLLAASLHSIKNLENVEIQTSPTKDSSIISISSDEEVSENNNVVDNCGATKNKQKKNSSSDERSKTDSDSLETPSQTVDKILNRVRKNR